MEIDQLKNLLNERVNQPVLAGLQGRIGLICGDAQRVLVIRDAQLGWQQADSHTDVDFFFESPAHAYELLCGNADVIAEFMAGRFRSSGYLLWTFPLLSAFRGS